MLSGMIEDGYEEVGYIAEQPRLHPALRFRFRPMTSGERTAAMREMERALKSPNPKMSEIVSARMMAERIIEWDLKNGDGEIVPITEAVMLKVKPALSNKLYSITITAVVGSDEDPEAEMKSESGSEAKAKLNGADQAEQDAKN